jgi:hypothetical protein
VELDKSVNIADAGEILSNIRVSEGLIMFKHYLLAFLVGWAFNYAIDVSVVTRSTVTWLQYGWLSPFYDSGKAPTKRS